MRAITILIAALLLAGCGGGNDNPPQYKPPSTSKASVTMDASRWQILYSPNTPSNPSQYNEGWSISIPTTNGLHYVVHPVSGTLAGATVRSSFRLELTPGNRLLEVEPCGANQARMRLYFQRRNDNMATDFWRWWSVESWPMVNGSAQLDATVSPGKWSSVYGAQGDSSAGAAAAFEAAAADVQAVGVTFGGCFAGHGIYAPDGGALFVMTGFGT